MEPIYQWHGYKLHKVRQSISACMAPAARHRSSTETHSSAAVGAPVSESARPIYIVLLTSRNSSSRSTVVCARIRPAVAGMASTSQPSSSENRTSATAKEVEMTGDQAEASIAGTYNAHTRF